MSDGPVESNIGNGEVIGLKFSTDHVTDVSPLRGLAQLTSLDCSGADSRYGFLVDLSPLKGMPLTHLGVSGWRGSDLTPLKGMPLKWLCCDGQGQKLDFTPLAGMPLENLAANYTQASDLTSLKGMPLTEPSVGHTKVSDLATCAVCP